MTFNHPPEGNGWDEWKNLVLYKLDDLSKTQNALRNQQAIMREELATLKAQGRIAGAIAGIVAGVLASLGLHIMEGRK